MPYGNNTFDPGDEFPIRINLEGPTDFAHSFNDLAKQLFGSNKKLILEYREHEGYETPEPIQFSLGDPTNKSTQEFLELEKRVRKSVAENPELQELLVKKSWDRQDRLFWEGGIDQIIIDEMKQSSVFKFANYNSDGTEIRNFNQLNGSGKQEYDCEAMALIKGLMMQRVEDLNLLGKSGEGYKKAYPYYYCSHYMIDTDNAVDGHAAIFCPALGNISDQKNYVLNAVENYGLENFKNSQTIYSYSGYRDGRVALAEDISDIDCYAFNIDSRNCYKEKSGELFLSTEQHNVAKGISDFVKKYNSLRKKVFDIEDAFSKKFADLHGDFVLSATEVTALGQAMETSVTAAQFTPQEKINLGLSAIFMKNSTGPDLISFAGATYSFEKFSDEVKPNQHLKLKL